MLRMTTIRWKRNRVALILCSRIFFANMVATLELGFLSKQFCAHLGIGVVQDLRKFKAFCISVQLITSQFRSRIDYLIQTIYLCLFYTQQLMKYLYSLAVFSTIYWWILIVAYVSFGHPVTEFTSHVLPKNNTQTQQMYASQHFYRISIRTYRQSIVEEPRILQWSGS